ncbi:hypothetical protein [Hydrogenophaga sp.]|uniref:DUF6891 domain-containing protein n=1 Tax=Hydrogenophaga sp. TaxID=1904254 RepID=UPI0027304510|nr:hypothetical protein [Hydrogenophaga sp.]MDP1684143.1 hypothetical protein [Hydrogenophaga sp.]
MTDTPPPSFFKFIDLAFPPAERMGAKTQLYHSPHQSLYGLRVIFMGRRPANAEIDRVLRECTALAAAHDANFDIFASAELLPDACTDLNASQVLNIHGRSHFLCFDCKTGVIGLRRIPGTRDPAPDPCLPDGDEPGEPDEADLDDGTEDMLTDVAEAIWYGFDSPAEIDAMIDSAAEEGAGFDVQKVKAITAEALAKKRRAEAGWPETTDCDRLDRAFARLHERGILALQCAGNTLDDGMQWVNEQLADERVDDGQYIGFCFFHSQDIDRALDGEGLYLAFGPVDSDEDKDAMAVGHKVCEALRHEGLQTPWNGSVETRIDLPGFCWQRRTPD